MNNITRDVISDLWPVYSSGEASEDTRALVESFLVEHPECRAEFESPFSLPEPERAIPPDLEARALTRTRELMRGGRWLHGVRVVAIVLTVLALIRFHADPLEIFVVRLAVAAIAWAVFGALVLRERHRAMRTTSPLSS